MNKKLFKISGALISAFCLFCTVVNAAGIDKLSSRLEMMCDEDFELYNDGYVPKDFICETGRCSVRVLEEDGNKFVRISNRAERETRVLYTLEQTMKGRIVIEYDQRADFVSICDVPAVLGMSDEGVPFQEIARVRITDSGRVQLNQTQSDIYETAKSVAEWKHVLMIIDTDADTCYFEYGDREIGVVPINIAGREISKLRFASRIIGEDIDIDNLKIYYDNEAVQGEESGSGAENQTEGIAMPVRRYREPANAYKISGDIFVDGALSEKDWTLSKKYNLCNIGQGNPLADAAFSVLRDDKGIYVGVWIYDAVLNRTAPEDQGWLRDQIEIYIDGRNNHSNIYDEDDRQYSYGLGRDMPDGHNSIQKRMGNDMKYAQAMTGYGWSAEMYIPFTDFCTEKYEDGDIIGFDIAYNDSNRPNERAGQLFWRGTSQNSAITNAFGDLKLAEGNSGEALTEAEKIAADAIFFESWNRYALSGGIKRKINSNHASVTPRDIDGVIYLPFRFVSEELGYKVTYDAQTGAVNASFEGNDISIKDSGSNVSRNGAVIQTNDGFRIIDDFLYVSCKDLSELTDIKMTIGRDCVLLGTEGVSGDNLDGVKKIKNTK